MSEITDSLSATQLDPLGLYVHVPFCAQTCDFCAFYQIKPSADAVSGYLRGIAGELALLPCLQKPTTVFWGGGTPGLLSPENLGQLGKILAARCDHSLQEWTVELAPSSVTDARLAVLKMLGVTRVSLGVQSFQPALLDALGRPHSRERIFQAYERIRHAGFASVNLDLIFAIPGQDEAAWLADIAQAVELAPHHLSTYCLSFEEDTALWIKLSKGKVKLDTEREARLYERTWTALEAAGYAQYEISNFAQAGHACRHNLNTWRMHSWVGLGPSAASQYDGWRGANVSNLEQWARQVDQGERMREDRAELTPQLLVEDALIFGLRINEGVDLAQLKRRLPTAPWPEVEALCARLVDDTLAVRFDDQLRLTLRGRLLGDAIGREILGAFSSKEAA